MSRDDIKQSDTSENIYRVLLIDETKTPEYNTNRKSKFYLNDRFILILLAILGLIAVTIIVLTIIFYINCRSRTDHLESYSYSTSTIINHSHSKSTTKLLPLEVMMKIIKTKIEE